MIQSLAADEKYKCADSPLLEKRIDACRLGENSLGYAMTSMIRESVMKCLNFNLTCPYKAGLYKVTNFKVNFNFRIPLPDIGKYCIKVDLFGKTKNARAFEKVVSWGGSGTLVQS